MSGNRVVGLLMVLLFLACAGKLTAQYRLSGSILEFSTGEPVSGANIIFANSRKGTSTDAKGRFEFNLLGTGNYTLNISHIGFTDTTIDLTLSGDLDLEIRMIEDSVEFASIVVTASRSQRIEEDVPQRVYSIQEETIKSYPATNADDLLKMVPGVVVNRSWGIFSRNASVTMRGMPGSTRSLILLDGIPLNKTSGGSVNWNLITPDEIEKIEVVKGPGSAVYGMNAMGGVINMITRQSSKKIDGEAGIGYGSYNTIQGKLKLLGKQIRESRGFYWKMGGFYRQGDGYILEPEETRTEYSSEAYLTEYNATALLGYQFSANQKLEVDYRYYHDKRGSGTKVYLEDGSFESFTNHNLRSSYDGYIGKTKVQVKGFYLIENYERQNESVNNSGEYKLTDTETGKTDAGIWLNFNKFIHPRHSLTWGIDVKYGVLDNQEIYRTSTDEIYTAGKLIFAGLFLQDEMSFVGDRLKVSASLRIDGANFYDGKLMVNNPTDKTGFPGNVDTTFNTSSWIQFSPKLSARYFIRPALSIYTSLASGFMPPRLDDLVGSRKIRRGFKIANPNLLPETLNSIELGLDWTYKEKLIVKPAFYYSRGHDFQYLVATGDYIDEDSDDPVAVYQRQNVSKVEASGFELGMDYFINKNLKLAGSYGYNHSEVLEYSSADDVDITGKSLNEVPQNLIFAGIFWYNKIVNLHINYTYTDDQWYDEENSEIIPGYSLINLRLSKTLFKKLELILDIQDLLDEQFVDRKGYLSPGRFILFELKYRIN